MINRWLLFPNCFEGTVKSHGGSKSVAALKSAGSFEEIQKSLSASAKAKVSAKLFSGGVESNYARHIKDNQFTKSFYFMQSIELPTAVFQLNGYGVNGLSKYGKSVY